MKRGEKRKKDCFFNCNNTWLLCLMTFVCLM